MAETPDHVAPPLLPEPTRSPRGASRLSIDSVGRLRGQPTDKLAAARGYPLPGPGVGRPRARPVAPRPVNSPLKEKTPEREAPRGLAPALSTGGETCEQLDE